MKAYKRLGIDAPVIIGLLSCKEMDSFKNIRTLLAITLSVIAVGCVREAQQPLEQDSENLHEVVFHAGWAPETKTVLQEDGSIWWSPGDEISLYIWGGSDETMYCLKSDCKEPSSITDFVGKIGEYDSNNVFYAIYPYDKARGMASFTIPTVQYATAGSLSPGQFVSFARSKDNNLSFYNACAGIKFSVAHDGIKKVVFKNRDNYYPITGDMKILFWDRFPESPEVYPDLDSEFDPNNIEETQDGPELSNYLTVLPAEGDYFIPGEYYYASLRPGVTSLVISYYTDNQVATTSYSYRGIERSQIAVLREKDKVLTFEDNNNYTYSGLGEFILPDGVDKNAIQEVVFHTLSDVTTDTVVPSSVPANWNGYNWIDYIPVYFELQGTTAHYYTKAEKYMMTGPNCISFMDWRELKTVDLSMFCTNQVTSFQSMFNGCVSLESVNLSSFDTSNARTFSAMFQLCKSLKTIDISNFSTRSLEGDGAECLFNRCYDLVRIDLGNVDFSECGTSHAMLWLSKFSKNCAIRCSSATRAKLSDDDSRLGSSADYITWVLPEEEIPDLEPIVDPNLYTSTDYSRDKTVRILHKATKGNGVDIVLLGDAYSDRMITDGTYDADMELAMDAILKDEPYASFKDYINVYTVYAVSANEIPYYTHTAFDASINQYDPVNGILSYSENYDVYRYASIAVPDKDLEDVAMILIINQAEGEGDSWTDGVAGYEASWNDNEYFDYAAGAKSIGMINRRDRSKTETFSRIVAHEFGHVFAKLADEYVLIYGEISDWEKQFLVDMYTHLGWWSNIDVTSDPQIIKWKKFLEDERYAGTGIGVYEGGYTYASGVWHPTMNSIMRFNQGMFNAPSREVIYKRIHKLALGKDWQYDYETFVEYDQKNIAAEKAAQAAPLILQSPAPEISRAPYMKIEKSISPDGKERISVIMN